MDNVMRVGDRVIWNEFELIREPISYGKRILDYGNGPFEIVEVSGAGVFLAKDGVKLTAKLTNAPIMFAKYWLKKIVEIREEARC